MKIKELKKEIGELGEKYNVIFIKRIKGKETVIVVNLKTNERKVVL